MLEHETSPAPIGMMVNAARLERNALIVMVDPVAIIVMRAREADHLPRGQILVAAVDWVGQKAAARVLQDAVEELFAVGAVELQRAVFQSGDDLVFLRVGELGKTLAVFTAARAIESGQRGAVLLCRRDRGLRTLLRRPLLIWPHHVVALKPAVRP